jgi:hypothetical protein
MSNTKYAVRFPSDGLKNAASGCSSSPAHCTSFCSVPSRNAWLPFSVSIETFNGIRSAAPIADRSGALRTGSAPCSAATTVSTGTPPGQSIKAPAAAA